MPEVDRVGSGGDPEEANAEVRVVEVMVVTKVEVMQTAPLRTGMGGAECWQRGWSAAIRVMSARGNRGEQS